MTEQKGFKTDKFFNESISKPFSIFNIDGFDVEVRRLNNKTDVWFCAYVELENSRFLSHAFLGYPTFRDGDFLGVDTDHAFNQEDLEAERLASALHQIEGIIKRYKQVIKTKE